MRDQALREALVRADRFDLAALAALFDGPRSRSPGDDPLLVAVRRRVSRHCHGARTRRFRETLLTLWPRHPRLREPELVDPLWALTAATWIRPLSDWRPEGRGRPTLFRSLVRHLLARWPVPAFLFAGLDLELGLAERFARLVALLGSGGSARDAVTRGLLPITMTRRMCHLFLTSPASVEPVEAIRRAQVTAFGGGRALADRVCATRLGRTLTDDEPFWATFLHWLVTHPELPLDSIGPLQDHLEHVRRGDRRFVLFGRSVAAMRRRVQAWHDQLARERRLKGTVFEPSGLPAGSWHLRHRLDEPGSEWTVEELLCSKALRAEGRAMKHCVHAYCRHVESGRTSIWSLRRDGNRQLTLEVDNRHNRIVQAKARLNRPATGQARQVMTRWAREADLIVSKHL